MLYKKLPTLKPPKPPKPFDLPQSVKTFQPFGKKKWVKAHWRFDYKSYKWEWILGHWSA